MTLVEHCTDFSTVDSFVPNVPVLSLLGVGTGAVAEVEELTKQFNWNVGRWFNFARVCALASGKIQDKKQPYADRVTELLEKAVPLIIKPRLLESLY